MPSRPLPASDLNEVLRRTPFAELGGARIFVTGGTGFFGHWLLESLLHANDALGLGVRVTALTRDAASFRRKAPHLAGHEAVALVEGDMASFTVAEERFTHILHAATDTVGADSESELAASIMAGTERVLALAKRTAAQSEQPVRMLYVSSGAVYGRGIDAVQRIREDFALPAQVGPVPATYDEAKRASEMMCLQCASVDLQVAIARCFAFVGPHLPLDAHFAIGNFIRDAIEDRPIHIKGDGTPLRSFLYMSDLAVWLWTLLIRAPQQSVVNVGSDELVSIAELAHRTAAALRPGLRVQIDGSPQPGKPVTTYVPDVARACALGLEVGVPLEDALRKTAAWYAESS